MSRQLIIPAVFLGLAVVIWFAFLRPVPVRTTEGIIRSKTFMPAGEYVQYQPGSRSSFQLPTEIPISEHFVLGIEVEGEPEDLRYVVNMVAASGFEIGQQVSIEYVQRGIPPFWSRFYVTDVKRSE